MSTLDPGRPLPADDLDEEDVAAELEALALRRRRKLPRVTLVLSVALVGSGAFIGGAEAQKHLGSSPTSTTNGNAAASLASRFRNAAGGGGATFTGAGATVGTVTAIKGSTLYVTDANGNTVKVTTSVASQVTKTVSGTIKDVHPGDSVVIRGTTKKNGTVAADSISLGGGGSLAVIGGGSAANGGATGFGGNGSKRGG